MFEEIRILTADLQVRRLLVLSDGAACGAQVLARVRVLDVLQGEGRHARVTPHHHAPVQALEESAHILVRTAATRLLYLTDLCIFTSAERKTPGGGRNGFQAGGTNISSIKKAGTLCSADVDTEGPSGGHAGEAINNLCQKAPEKKKKTHPRLFTRGLSGL